LIIAGFVVVPVAVVGLIVWVTQALGPWLWVLLLAGIGAAVLYVMYRSRTSAPNVRSEHEQELLNQLSHAERQQQALPQMLSEAEIEKALASKGLSFDVVALSTFPGARSLKSILSRTISDSTTRFRAGRALRARVQTQRRCRDGRARA